MVVTEFLIGDEKLREVQDIAKDFNPVARRFDDFRDRLDLEIEPEGFETVGGYILTRLGRVPSVGETFELDGLFVEVLEAERRRIHKVRVRKPAPARVS